MKAELGSIVRTGRAIVGMATAALFLLQILAVGVASGAMAARGAPGAVCATTASGAKTDSAPTQSPHVDACCILHCGFLADLDAVDAPAGSPSAQAFPVIALGLPVHWPGERLVAPELRSLSPRAPPAPLA